MSKITTLHDLVLEQLFAAMNILAKSTILRLFLALYLLPVYCFTKAVSVLPSVIRHLPLLVTGRGREKLITRADVYRRYEVFAIDWLGHGTSDKPLHISEISFELHMHTLRRVIEQLDLAEFYIAAHDWGGCIALCTIPTLPAERHCKGLFLLNTFLPPRPHDISLHYYLLYWIWFFSTGICGPLLPDSFVLRFMAPNMSVKASEVYSQPYAQSLFKTKTSINRFSHIVPGLPDCIYDLRQTFMWRTIEGLLGPEHFTNLNAQAWLANRDQEVRKWWSSSSPDDDKAAAKAPESVMTLFGRDDPLLPEFKNVLERSIQVSRVLQGGEAGWLPGAGHYPMEQKPKEIAHCLVQLLERQ
ncbi:hypothetical protein LTR40_001435 [Exophiala xenobiotica]|nr:hypothetical protein LTR40_001435 [Exophiala xenobiotica]